MHKLLKDDQRSLYVHCTSGVSRSPTIAAVYLSLFKKVKEWPDSDKIIDMIKENKNKVHPNDLAVKRTITENKKF